MKAIQIPYDQNFEKKCRFASEVGFRYISVNFNDTPDPSDATYDKAPEQILKILEKYDLKVVQTHLYYYHPYLSVENMEDDLERRVLREIEVSGKIGAPWCVWHPRVYKAGEWENGVYNEELTFYYNDRTIPRYLEQAKRFGTGIALENLFDTMSCSDYKLLVRFCDHFEADNIGVCWDTGHANLMDFEQDEAIRFVGERIKCTHIHNNFNRNYDLHLPPDAGTIDWNKVMKAFENINYKGPLTLETHCLYPYDDQLLWDFVRYNFNCLEFLQRHLKK